MKTIALLILTSCVTVGVCHLVGMHGVKTKQERHAEEIQDEELQDLVDEYEYKIDECRDRYYEQVTKLEAEKESLEWLVQSLQRHIKRAAQ